jgi:hypothetical protein
MEKQLADINLELLLVKADIKSGDKSESEILEID